MKGWEYKAVAIAAGGWHDVVATLNELGKEGWEAVGFQMLQDGTTAVLLKRPTA